MVVRKKVITLTAFGERKKNLKKLTVFGESGDLQYFADSWKDLQQMKKIFMNKFRKPGIQ